MSEVNEVDELIEESVEEPKRKLASIQRIASLHPIEGADRIEVAKVEGWNVVVQKGLYQPGDLCVYFEIDSVLPAEHFPELEKVKYRIKTIRLRGQISQGYCIPMSVYNQILGPLAQVYEEGFDCTELLSVEKYVPQTRSSGGGVRLGRTVGTFPSHLVSKTDEERIQSNVRYLAKMRGREYEITVKCDGSSMTVGCEMGEFFIASRNMKKEYDPETCDFAKAAEKYDLKRIMEHTGLSRYILQGECCGPRIQGNKMGLTEIDYFVFNVFDTQTKRMLPYKEMRSLSNIYGFKLVPFVEWGDSFDFSIDELLDIARGQYVGTNNHREGIVVRSYTFPENYGGYLSFKVINNDFLLGEK